MPTSNNTSFILSGVGRQGGRGGAGREREGERRGGEGEGG